MKKIINLIRKDLKDDRTLGELYIDNRFFCYTLEDKYRGQELSKSKIKGQTAIPNGLYKLEISFSPRLQKDMVHLIAVPFFDGILIHGGNTPADTLGCILAGFKSDGNNISDCANAISEIKEFVKDNQEVYINISIQDINITLA